MKQTIAYLGGPMRGLPFWNFPAFEEAAAALRQPGPHWQTPFIIHSPAEHDLSLGLEPPEDGTVSFPVATCLDWDFQKIAESDCVIVLPGWETSIGCHWEFTVAHALGKLVFQYPELTPVELPEVVTAPVSVSKRHQFGSPRRFIPYGEAFGADPEVAARVRAEMQFEKTVVSESGGKKGIKTARMDLLPWDALYDLSIHFGENSETHGGKYPDRNWESGYDWSLSFGALGRHLAAWWNGEELDEEGHPHIRAIHWHASVLHAFVLRGEGNDNRDRH